MLLKTVKWLFILLILLIIAVVIAVNVIDVNRYKPQIESYVSDTYGRKLSIGGDLSLKFFPRVAVALPESTLSEPGSDTTAFQLKSARVSVAVMPLLSGRLEAEKVQLHGLRASLTRFKDGTTSIDDLTGPSDATAKEHNTDNKGDSAGGIGEFEIGGVELLDAAISIKDEVGGTTLDLTDVNLNTGELADNQETPVSFEANVKASNPALNARVTVEATAQLDSGSGRYTVQNADITVKGDMDGLPVDQQLVLESLRGGSDSLVIDKLTLTSRLEQDSQQLVSVISTPVEFDVGRGLLNLRQLQGKVDITAPQALREPLAIPFNGVVELDINAEKVNGSLNADAPEASVKTSWQVNGFANPKIRFDLTGDTINVDRYLTPAADSAEKSAQASASSASADATPVDLSALNNLNIDGKISIARLIAQGLTVENVKAAVKSAKGVLNLAPLSMDLYGGTMKGSASARASDNRVVLSSDLSAVNIGPLLKDLTQDDLIEGNGEVRLRLRTAGKTVGAMKKALAGEARMALRDGAIVGINLGQKIRDAKSMLQAGQASAQSSDNNLKTDFAVLTASFQIANGVAVNTDLSGKSPLIRLGGGGKVDIGAGSLDYTARASVVGTSKGQGGKDAQELRGLTIPVRLTGTFEALSWEIDWAEAAREALKSRAAEKLKGQLDPKKEELKAQAREKQAELEKKKDDKVEELKEKAASKIGDKLKGLLGN